MEAKNILIVGVGGQGTLLASRILGNLVVDLGFEVKISEIHGMSQRGGSVVTHIRYGEKVHSPLVEVGQADIILSFEVLEALRWKHFLRREGKMVVNSQKIFPMPVITGTCEYPKKIIEQLKEVCKNVIDIDALTISRGIGSIKVVNTVLLGVLAQEMNIEKERWIESIRKTVPEKTIDMNILAFEMGCLT